VEKKLTSAPLFLRKLVLGIRAQASGKNHVAVNAYGAPIRPIENESGSSLRGRSRISKAGSPVIRAKLYMATISALQHNPDIKIQNQRLLKNGKSKMSALCAAMRKLVQICFGVIKHLQTQHLLAFPSAVGKTCIDGAITERNQ
jgi:transposase